MTGFSAARKTLSLIGLGLAVCMAGCSAPNVAVNNYRPGLSCVDDSLQCIAQRQSVMKDYMADRSKSWVKQPANADAHASGVRLMAMKNRKRELNCDELQHAKREADSAPGTLRGPAGSHLSPAQVARGAMLASEVARELGREINSRCKRT